MKILLIGGTRFLGREIARVFIKEGCEVYAMNRGNGTSVAGVAETIRCDKADRENFAKVLKRWRWDLVIDTILDDDDLKFVVETLGGNVGHFIHTGSIGVYGDARRIPASEDLPLAEYEGEYVVFNHKIRQDQVLMRAFHERRFPATILRECYIYGPGDFLLDGWSARTPEFFKMLKNGDPLRICGDGRALLHPGHVRDLARAFVHAAERPRSVGQSYNIAGPQALMMKDYLGLIAEIMNVEARIEYDTPENVHARYPAHTTLQALKFSTQHMCASIEKAREQLDWSPRIQLETGLRESVDWMLKRMAG